ncbi:MAG: IPExxxVDY family protein [Bacteroidota bacterium]
MKKNRLVSEFKVDFDLYGIVCNVKDYKLAWFINSKLNLSLVKQEEVSLEFSDHSVILFSTFKHQTSATCIELVQNKLVGQGASRSRHLVPELAQFDYLLKWKDESEELSSEMISEAIKDISLVEYVARLNFEDLKSKENLLY